MVGFPIALKDHYRNFRFTVLSCFKIRLGNGHFLDIPNKQSQKNVTPENFFDSLKFENHPKNSQAGKVLVNSPDSNLSGNLKFRKQEDKGSGNLRSFRMSHVYGSGLQTKLMRTCKLAHSGSVFNICMENQILKGVLIFQSREL